MADDLKILSPAPLPLEPEKRVQWVPDKIRKLSEVKAGHWIKIMAVQLNPPAREQLYALGLIENRKARVIHNDHRGRIMLDLDGEIFLLGRRETPGIQVREFIPLNESAIPNPP